MHFASSISVKYRLQLCFIRSRKTQGFTMISNITRNLLGVANQSAGTVVPRYAGTVGTRSASYAPVPESIRRKMEKFQRHDGVPIHLKGGAGDKLLFGLTVGLCFLGIGMYLEMVYDMAFPKKKK